MSEIPAGVPEEPAQGKDGLAGLLPAIAITGVVGYLIQIAVPLWADGADDYVTFSVFWATLYIIVAALSGVQQEIARAVTPSARAQDYRVLSRYILVVSVAILLVVSGVSVVIAPPLFGDSAWAFAALLVLGAVSYVSLAAIGGVLFGAHRRLPVMLFLVLDTSLRLVLMLLTMTVSDSAVVMALAVVLPFLLSAVILGLVAKRSVPSIALDADLPKLLRNSFQTVVASAAMGCIISGLPLFLALAGASAYVGTSASVILLATLVRAPLVIPLMALQSFFIVRFRHAARMGRQVAVYAALLLGVAVAAAALGAFVGPPLFSLLFVEYEPVSAALVFGLVLSAGFMGLLFITGAGVLAGDGHGWYLAGWIVAASGVISVLVVPWGMSFETTVVSALFVGPLLGGACHLAALVLQGRRRARAAYA